MAVSLSLTNERHHAPPIRQGVSPVAIFDDCLIDLTVDAHTALASIPNPENLIGEPWARTARRDVLRNLMESSIRAYWPQTDKTEWSGQYWDIYRTYQDAATNVWNMPDKGDWSRANFYRCHWLYKSGLAIVSDKNEVYTKETTCGRPACWKCGDRGRKRTAKETADLIEAVYQNHPGGEAMTDLTFTLPREVEADPLHDVGIEKALKTEIDNLIKALYGRATKRGRRSNISYLQAIHPAGTKDIGRDRWHMHTMVLPCEIIDTETGKELVWLRPAKIAKGHSSRRWKLDLSWIKNRWQESVEKIFDKKFNSMANVQVKVRMASDKNFMKQVRFSVDYNYRSFSRDFSKAAIRANYKEKRIVTKGEDVSQDVNFWRGWTAWEFAERYKWIRSKNKVAGRGWLHLRNKYIEACVVLGPVPEKEIERPAAVYAPVKADIETHIHRQYDHKTGRTYTEKKRIWRFFNAHTGRTESLDEFTPKDKERMRPWLWDELPHVLGREFSADTMQGGQ